MQISQAEQLIFPRKLFGRAWMDDGNFCRRPTHSQYPCTTNAPHETSAGTKSVDKRPLVINSSWMPSNEFDSPNSKPIPNTKDSRWSKSVSTAISISHSRRGPTKTSATCPFQASSSSSSASSGTLSPSSLIELKFGCLPTVVWSAATVLPTVAAQATSSNPLLSTRSSSGPDSEQELQLFFLSQQSPYQPAIRKVHYSRKEKPSQQTQCLEPYYWLV